MKALIIILLVAAGTGLIFRLLDKAIQRTRENYNEPPIKMERGNEITEQANETDLEQIDTTHTHKWEHRYYGGRKQGTPKYTPASQVVACDCGTWAVKHHNETEYIILSDTKDS